MKIQYQAILPEIPFILRHVSRDKTHGHGPKNGLCSEQAAYICDRSHHPSDARMAGKEDIEGTDVDIRDLFSGHRSGGADGYASGSGDAERPLGLNKGLRDGFSRRAGRGGGRTIEEEELNSTWRGVPSVIRVRVGRVLYKDEFEGLITN
eukprot:392869-Amorphochlora_amoeboformis.AAC.1